MGGDSDPRFLHFFCGRGFRSPILTTNGSLFEEHTFPVLLCQILYIEILPINNTQIGIDITITNFQSKSEKAKMDKTAKNPDYN